LQCDTFFAYLKVGEEVGHLHKLAVEWQKKYSEQYRQKVETIKDLENNSRWEEETPHQQI
jgi:hypothetical protein